MPPCGHTEVKDQRWCATMCYAIHSTLDLQKWNRMESATFFHDFFLGACWFSDGKTRRSMSLLVHLKRRKCHHRAVVALRSPAGGLWGVRSWPKDATDKKWSGKVRGWKMLIHQKMKPAPSITRYHQGLRWLRSTKYHQVILQKINFTVLSLVSIRILVIFHGMLWV